MCQPCGTPQRHGRTLPRRHIRIICKGRAANRMNWRVLRLLFLHELKMLLRARRTVIMAIVLPAVIMPLMLYAQKYSFERRERMLSGTVYRYTITGILTDRVRTLINQTRRERSQAQSASAAQLTELRLIEMSNLDPQTALDRDEIQFYIDTGDGPPSDPVPQIDVV